MYLLIHSSYYLNKLQNSKNNSIFLININNKRGILVNDIYLALQKSYLFKNKSIGEIEQLISNISYKIVNFEKNELIFTPNKTADTMAIIISGSVETQKFFPCGKVIVLSKKTKYDLIAEPSIFAEIKYYPATACVTEPSKILFIHKNQLLKLFTIDSEIMQNFLESVSNSMVKLKQQITILSLNTIQERIICYLVYAYENTNSTSITLPFSKKTWSKYMNVSRTSLSRELRKLEENNIISFKKRTIEIIDLQKLNKLYARTFSDN